MQICGCQNSKTPELIDKKIGMGDYVGDITPHAKIHSNRPFGGVPTYASNITLAWFLARDVMLALYMPSSCVCTSVRLFVCHKSVFY